jgi:hypothetical protein
MLLFNYFMPHNRLNVLQRLRIPTESTPIKAFATVSNSKIVLVVERSYPEGIVVFDDKG